MDTPDPMNTQTGSAEDRLTSHADEVRERLDTETIVDGAGRKIGEVVKPPDPADDEYGEEHELTDDERALILGVGSIVGQIYGHDGRVEILGVLADVEIADTYPDGILLRVRPVWP